ncbi:MAG: dihydropteroate synthase [Spirochaetales bacterium]|nr:dihydropteroate synthase [Spirochaetales bacterium]
MNLKNKRPLVMGIINCTPDSFYSSSRKQGVRDVLDQALRMKEQGADILDIGGESTRPGSKPVPLDEEMERVVPVVAAIRKEMDIPLSVDTRKSAVARAALDQGANIINDISALRDDPDMTAAAAAYGCPVCLMHMQGNPETMQNKPEYASVVDEVLHFLLKAAADAEAQGIRKENIILDPGIGFGKRLEDNLALIRNIGKFAQSGYSVLMGLSRKSFLGTILDAEADDRLIGSLTANGYCAAMGADILRVHDVGETVQMLTVLQEILWKD